MPFLQLVTHWESYMHVETSGTVVDVCQTLSKDYMYGTAVEVKPGDRVIFHYLAIKRDRDGQKITHHKKIGNDYIIKYSDIFCIVRGDDIIPVNGFVILEGEPEEFKSNLIIPDYLKKKRSKVVCTIRHIGSCVSYNNVNKDHSMDFEDDTDEFEVGQKVVIPSWGAIPLMVQEHSILGQDKIYYRSQRRWMTDYNWVMSEIRAWQLSNPTVESKEHAITAAAVRDFRMGSTEESVPMQNAIIHKQRTKHKRQEGRVFT